jgi:hypothetical protein
MDISVNAPMQAANVNLLWLWYTGSDPIRKGEAVCYDVTTGEAGKNVGKRHNRVSRPDATNNRAFAGVAARDYFAEPNGQFIEVYGPGSKGVEIALGTNVTLNSGFLTFTAGGGSAAGRFVKAGFKGRGSAYVRQTVTAVLEASMTGAWSLATDGKTLTVSSTAGISAGDAVVLLGGEDEGSDKAIIPGRYTVASITSSTVLVLTASAVGATPGGALTCTGYAFTGNPTCQADLMEGDESGGVEFVCPPNTGGASVMSYMTGGVTFICGGITVGTAAAGGALADGENGLLKGFHCLGTLTTNGATVTPATAGIQNAINTTGGAPLALAKATFDAADECLFLVWFGKWKEIASAGCTLAAS